MKRVFFCLFILFSTASFAVETGSIQSVDCNWIVGYVKETDKPEGGVFYALSIDGVSYLVGSTDVYRNELSGLYGFQLVTPERFKDGQNHSVGLTSYYNYYGSAPFNCPLNDDVRSMAPNLVLVIIGCLLCFGIGVIGGRT